MSSQKHPWQISSGPRRLQPRWRAGILGNGHHRLKHRLHRIYLDMTYSPLYTRGD
jgi:hypothetical protein